MSKNKGDVHTLVSFQRGRWKGYKKRANNGVFIGRSTFMGSCEVFGIYARIISAMIYVSLAQGNSLQNIKFSHGEQIIINK